MKNHLEMHLAEFVRINPVQKEALKRLKINSILDLLYHFPSRYGDTAEARSVSSLIHGEDAVIFGKISALKTSKGFRSKIPMATGTIEDETGKINCVWFNQPYVAKMFADGMTVRIEGRVSARRKKKKKEVAHQNVIETDTSTQDEEEAGTLYFSNPKIEQVDTVPTGVGDSLFGDTGKSHTLYPVYPESRGVTTLWIYHTILKIFKSDMLNDIVDPIPAHILEKYHLPTLKSAIIWIHTPQNREHALSARKRFSFEEIFSIQLGKQRSRKLFMENPAYVIEKSKLVDEFVKRFPFEATEAQNNAIQKILSDLKKGTAMSRLLEGDVGSGKTAVAAATAYAVVTSRPFGQNYGTLQVAYMCPTEILASQHFESFIKYFSYLGIQIGFISSSGCRKFPSKVNPKGWTDISRVQLLKWVASGEISILIGTHSLIQKSVKFKHLAYAIIDEQHRFGTAQRSELIRKENIGGKPIIPHLLSMTATPIPRTLALTMYGDLDLTLLDQSPYGRKRIITELVLPGNRQKVYEQMREIIVSGRQGYVICPRIDAPDPDKEMALNAKSVKEEAKRLQNEVFPEFNIGILHGKMSQKEKDKVMDEFNNGEIHILCATSVVEVGVNVPNATVILIEGAERFGLSQLHQLRGRVMRSEYQPYCFIFTETNSAKSIERLKALENAKNGFELAELDLMQRGVGELTGARQWGVSDVAMEALKNLKMVEAARNEAITLIEEDIDLKKYPELAKNVERIEKSLHLE